MSTMDSWGTISQDDKSCAVAGCAAPPERRCPQCYNYYCHEHSNGHIHFETEGNNNKTDDEKNN